MQTIYGTGNIWQDLVHVRHVSLVSHVSQHALFTGYWAIGRGYIDKNLRILFFKIKILSMEIVDVKALSNSYLVNC